MMMWFLFFEPSKNAVVPSQWQWKQLEIKGVKSYCEVTMSIYEVRGQFWDMCNLKSSWPLTSFLPLRMVSHPKLISNLFWFSLTWRKVFFSAFINSHLVIIYCHTPYFFNFFSTYLFLFDTTCRTNLYKLQGKIISSTEKIQKYFICPFRFIFI